LIQAYTPQKQAKQEQKKEGFFSSVANFFKKDKEKQPV
jgi:hypothetical protein